MSRWTTKKYREYKKAYIQINRLELNEYARNYRKTDKYKEYRNEYMRAYNLKKGLVKNPKPRIEDPSLNNEQLKCKCYTEELICKEEWNRLLTSKW